MFWGKQRSASSPSRLSCSSLFCECPKFCDLAKQRRKIFGGVSEVGKDDFSLYFFWRCVVFLVLYYSSAAIARQALTLRVYKPSRDTICNAKEYSDSFRGNIKAYTQNRPINVPTSHSSLHLLSPIFLHGLYHLYLFYPAVGFPCENFC